MNASAGNVVDGLLPNPTNAVPGVFGRSVSRRSVDSQERTTDADEVGLSCSQLQWSIG